MILQNVGNYLPHNKETRIFSDTIERTTNFAQFCYVLLGLQFQLPITFTLT